MFSRFARQVAIGIPALVLLTMTWERRWLSEDALIFLRIARNVIDGHGPVFNVAERVEAHTSPLWLGILVIWGRLGLPLEGGSLALGVVFAVAGLLAAQAGAWRLWRHSLGEGDAHVLFLPLGAAVIVAVPVVWDFTTSGLEVGLTFAWLGFSFCALSWLLTGLSSSAGSVSGARRGPWLAVACGVSLGPVIRPDLAIFSVTYTGILLLGFGTTPISRRHPASWVQLVIAACALPLSYQVFRMGFYAALVPNNALAKEAQLAYWQQGWRYAHDFVGTYGLAFPVLVLLVWWAVALQRSRKRRAWPVTALLSASIFAAALHVVFVIRVGGDFMHGRLLLPGLFGLLLPVATVAVLPAQTSRWGAVSMRLAAGSVMVWAVVCSLYLRPPYEGRIGPDGIADERGFFVRMSGRDNPVRATDYVASIWFRRAIFFRDRAERWSRSLVVLDGSQVTDAGPLAAGVDSAVGLVVAAGNIGIQGYVSGSKVHMVDPLGLADPLASRLRLDERGRPGHEKYLPNVWARARFTERQRGYAEAPSLRAAREVLSIGVVASLLRVIEEPLTARRFFQNLSVAWRFHRLRIDPNTIRAQAELSR